MNYFASRQRGTRKHVIGLTAVVVLHGLLFWAINVFNFYKLLINADSLNARRSCRFKRRASGVQP